MALALVYLAANPGWTHAAAAGAIAGRPCPHSIVKVAEASVLRLFGASRSQPWFVCLDHVALGLNVPHGTTRFAPMMPAIIVLGPQGQTGDVASHEHVHAELASRTSVLLRTYHVPTWFDEGLAMQVDGRAEYGRAALERLLNSAHSAPPDLDDLATPSAFFGHGTRSVFYYAFSKCVLEEALADMGMEALDPLLDGIAWAKPVTSDRFRPYAKVCARKPDA